MKIKQGWMPNHAPQGYLNDFNALTGERTIKVDELRFKLIRKAWEFMLIGNYSIIEILNLLNNEWGYRTRQTKSTGGTPLSRSTLYAIFHNPFYTGIIVHQDIEYKGRHISMVTRQEFEKVGKILSDRNTGNRNHMKTLEFIYKPLLTCGPCKGTITAERKYKSLKSGKTNTYTYYHCTRNKKGIKCKEKSITETQITDKLKCTFKSVIIHPILKNWAIAHLKDAIEKEQKQVKNIETSKQITIEKLALEKLALEKQTLTRKLAIGTIADEDYKSTMKTIKEEMKCLEPKAINKMQALKQECDKVNKALSIITKCEYILEKGSLYEKREFIRRTASNLFIKGKKLHLKPQKWLLSLERFYNMYANEIASLEPPQSGPETDYCTNKVGLRSIWLGVVDDIRNRPN